MSVKSDIIIKRYNPSLAPEWKSFLLKSNNGTLFHDLDFLAYHAEGRFDEHHLMFYRSGRLVALLPAAIVSEPDGRNFLKSPYGASVGGFVIPAHVGIETVLDIISSTQSYAGGIGLHGIELRLGPNIYHHEPNSLIDFCLTYHSFRLTRRWLTFVIPLYSSHTHLSGIVYSKSKKYDIRTNLKKGVSPSEADHKKLDEFYDMLLETLSRHNASPTHSKAELQDIFNKVSGRVRLFLCSYNDIEIAGVLVFMLNACTAYTYYICEKDRFKKMCGPAVLIAYIADQLAREGIEHLDLGPSASTYHLNRGAVFFKEGLGSEGFCRDEWRWESDVVPGS